MVPLAMVVVTIVWLRSCRRANHGAVSGTSARIHGEPECEVKLGNSNSSGGLEPSCLGDSLTSASPVDDKNPDILCDTPGKIIRNE